MTPHDPDRPGALGCLIDDLPLMVMSEIVRGQQHQSTGGMIDHDTGVAAGVEPVVAEHDHIAPGPTIVFRPTHEDVDVAGVTTSIQPTFAERKQTATGRHGDGGDPVGVVATFTTDEDIGLRDGGRHRLRCSRHRCNSDQYSIHNRAQHHERSVPTASHQAGALSSANSPFKVPLGRIAFDASSSLGW